MKLILKSSFGMLDPGIKVFLVSVLFLSSAGGLFSCAGGSDVRIAEEYFENSLHRTMRHLTFYFLTITEAELDTVGVQDMYNVLVSDLEILKVRAAELGDDKYQQVAALDSTIKLINWRYREKGKCLAKLLQNGNLDQSQDCLRLRALLRPPDGEVWALLKNLYSEIPESRLVITKREETGQPQASK